jgi:sodium transport system permease protein
MQHEHAPRTPDALMGLDLSTVATLYRTELRMAIRDKRTVFFSLVLPLALMPVILFSSLWVQKKRTAELATMLHRYAVTGPQAETARFWIAEALARPAKGQAGSRFAASPGHFEAAAVMDPEAALQSGDLAFYVVADKQEPATASQTRDSPGESAPAGTPRLTFVYRGDRDTSRSAAFELRQRLERLRRDLQARLLESHGFPLSPVDVAPAVEQNVASARQVAGLNLGRMLTLFLLLFVFTGGAVVATDALAGEKERGTLETLLATAAGRNEIIAAKSLLILTTALLITTIQALNFLAYVAFKVVPAGTDLAAAVTPATAALLFVLYLPVVALVSSALLATSGWARSYKEAQLYFMPVMLLGLLPALVPMLPAVHLRSAIVVVPIANIAVAAKEILTGSRDWPFIVAAWLVTALAAAGLTRATVRMLRTERLISAADIGREELVAGPALFPRRVLRAFALMWVATTVASSYIGANLRGQILFNIGVVLIGGSLLLIRLYRLDLRAALALRPVKPVIWLGVLAGVPGGWLTATGIFRLMSLVLPVPHEWIESFGKQLAPQDVPLWQLLALTALLPGIGEEIAFRGVLLHGLSKRLRPVALCCAVGVIFGIFHFDMARLVPVSCLGAILAGATLLTGSIFPAMVWHALNNGLAMTANAQGFPVDNLPPHTYLAGLALVAVAAWIFWRHRTPYPGLRR